MGFLTHFFRWYLREIDWFILRILENRYFIALPKLRYITHIIIILSVQVYIGGWLQNHFKKILSLLNWSWLVYSIQYGYISFIIYEFTVFPI